MDKVKIKGKPNLNPPEKKTQKSTIKKPIAHAYHSHGYKHTVVGVRELKGNLSLYIHKAQSGEIVVVTERGKVVVQIVPVPASTDEMSDTERNLVSVRAGLVEWSGKKLQTSQPDMVNKNDTMASDIVIEERGY
jgi:prevent-host-death family protein